MQPGRSDNSDSGLLERLLFRVAKKWVAGSSAEEALTAARNTNARGMGAILNFLGEDAKDSEQIESTVSEYL